jgi:hypothetical protein
MAASASHANTKRKRQAAEDDTAWKIFRKPAFAIEDSFGNQILVSRTRLRPTADACFVLRIYRMVVAGSCKIPAAIFG